MTPRERIARAGVLATVAISISRAAPGSVTLYESEAGFEAWTAATSSITTIQFNEFPQNTFLSDQYLPLGVSFVSDDADVILNGPSAFPLDAWGINGLEVVEMEFTGAIHSFAYHHPGWDRVRLYLGEDLVFDSATVGGSGGSGIGFFSGFISTTPFDRVQITDYPFGRGNVSIDNVYFQSVPAPSGIAILAALGFGHTRGRRRCQAVSVPR